VAKAARRRPAQRKKDQAPRRRRWPPIGRPITATTSSRQSRPDYRSSAPRSSPFAMAT
jgi:hypothetical protein